MDKNDVKKEGSSLATSSSQKRVPLNFPTKQASPQIQRNNKKPPPPTRPKPAIPQKPVNFIANKSDSEKRKSLKRQTSGPKPPLPNRPPSLKRPHANDAGISGQAKPKTEGAEAIKRIQNDTHVVSPANNAKVATNEVSAPLLRTMSGPIKWQQNQQLEKPRSVSLLDKENVAPKPLPRPKTARRGSNEAPRPVPPPRTKRSDQAKPLVQDAESDCIKEEVSPTQQIPNNAKAQDSSANKEAVEKVTVALDDIKDELRSGSFSAANEEKSMNTVEPASSTTSEVNCNATVQSEGESEHDIDHEITSNYVMPDISPVKQSESMILSKTELKESTELKSERKRQNQYENVPAFKPAETTAAVKPPETPKKQTKNPYENVPSPLKMNNAENSANSVVVDGGNNSNIAEKKLLRERIDSDDKNDYENLTDDGVHRTQDANQRDQCDHDEDDKHDYENAEIADRRKEQLVGCGGGQITEDFQDPDFKGDSSPFEFKHLRIDADDDDLDNAYDQVPRKGMAFNQANDDRNQTMVQSRQIESLSPESYYQSPSASPKPPARRSLFGNDETQPLSPQTAQAQKRNRRPPPQPPMFDTNSNILRSKANMNDKKFSSKTGQKILPSARLLPSSGSDEDIYVVPKGDNSDSSSLKDSLGGENESLVSYTSGSLSSADDFSHHIYKEPSVHSGDSVNVLLTQEYSVPAACPHSGEYIDPDNFPKSVNDKQSILDGNRQSYGESDSSVSTRSSGGMNLANNIDNDYESIEGGLQRKSRSDSIENHSGSEYVDMSPMKEDKHENARDYLTPMTLENTSKRPRKPPGRPAPPTPMRPTKRPEDLPLPPVPAALTVPEDMSKSDSLDGRYERIQSLRREMGLPPTNEGEELDTDSDSEDELRTKEVENGEKKTEATEVDGKPKSKLYHIAHEILTTERTFVNALRLVCDEFAAAAKQMVEKDPSSLPKHAFSQMFDDIEMIYDLDKKFLQELEERMRNWDSHNRIGDIVRKYGYFLKMYTNYIKGYDKAMAVFQDCCQKMPKFAALVKEYERMPSFQNLKVTSYMLKPIQRIPSYRLLLIDYLKHLPNESKDYQDVSNGLNVVSEVAKHINESMKEGDKFQTMLKLQARIINSKEIVKAGRYLLKEGILSKLSRKEAQERMFFLLTDCLLYCEHAPVSNQYKLREELPLANMTLDVPENIDFNKEFTIITTKRSFTVAASSNEERDEWATALKNAIDDVSRKIGTFIIKQKPSGDENTVVASPTKDIGRIAPNWVPDARATMCSICCRRFTAYNRRHHCRACGEIVCKDCSSYEAPLPYLDFDAARVCEKCYQHLYETLVDEEEPNEKAAVKETKLKRSKSAISSKFRVIKKTKRDRATRKTLPSTLTEVGGKEQECNISGYLVIMKKKKQKKRWFVLKEHALYSYKAPSDPAAHSTLAVLGYTVNTTGNFDTGEFIFQLEHSGLKEPYVYKAESRASAEMWVNALRKASSLQIS